MRLIWILFSLLGLCSVFGCRWGYKPFYSKDVDAEGWFFTPSRKMQGRICKACAALEQREVTA